MSLIKNLDVLNSYDANLINLLNKEILYKYNVFLYLYLNKAYPYAYIINF